MSVESSRRETTGRKILPNFGYLAVGKLFGDISTFAFFIVFARIYGSEGLGEYSFAMGLTGVLMVVADFGLYHRSITDMSRIGTTISAYYGRILATRLLLCVLALLVLIPASVLIPALREMTWVVLLIGVYQIVFTLMDGFGAMFVAREEMHVTGLLEFSLRSVTALAGITIALTGGPLVLAVAALPIVAGFHAMIAYVYGTRRYGRISPSATLSEVRGVLRDALPYAGHSLLAELSSRAALILVGFILGTTAVGVFNAAYRIVFVIFFIPIFAGLAVFPVASRLYATSRVELQRLYRNTLNTAIILGIPIAAGLWVIAPAVIDLLYGQEFSGSVKVLQVLSPVVLAVFVRTAMEYLLRACDRQRDVTKSRLIVALASISICYWLIVNQGLVGAAFAMLAGEISLVILLGRQLVHLLGWPLVGLRVAAGVTASAAFVVVLLAWQPGLVLAIPTAVLIYGSALLLFGDIRRSGVRLLRSYIFNPDRIRPEADRV